MSQKRHCSRLRSCSRTKHGRRSEPEQSPPPYPQKCPRSSNEEQDSLSAILKTLQEVQQDLKHTKDVSSMDSVQVYFQYLFWGCYDLQALVVKTLSQTVLQWLYVCLFVYRRSIYSNFCCYSQVSTTPRCSPRLAKSQPEKARPCRNGSRLPKLSTSYRA